MMYTLDLAVVPSSKPTEAKEPLFGMASTLMALLIVAIVPA